MRRRAARDVARVETRQALIEEIRDNLVATSFPRLQLMVVLGLAGSAGFLTSVVLLWSGLTTMALRYPLAVLGGYVAFVLLLRLWIAWQRQRLSVDVEGDVIDVFSNIDLPARGGTAAAREAPVFAGGSSGGGGGGASWGSTANALKAPDTAVARAASAVRPSTSGSTAWDALSFDADDLWWLVLAIALLASAVVLLGYVVYIAPLLLAEIALDAALVSSVYRRLRPQDARHWASGIVRRTWIPVTMLALCLAGAGYALQRVAPEARSIGGVIRHLAD